jgi:hypothetical protein
MVKKCPECNHYISDTVSVCPHCGYAINSEESPSPIHIDEDSQENVDLDELVNQENETEDAISYEAEDPQQAKKNYIPIILGCILIIGIVIGIIGFSSKENNEPSVVVTDSIVAVVDSVIEEPIMEIDFSTIPVSYGKETDDINTEVVIDFPQTNNEILQESVVSFIVKALTDDFTWGENSRPTYDGDLTDGRAIAEFFVNDKVREITEERARDSIDSFSWEESISIKMVCETKNLISYQVNFGGSHGGVGGGILYGATFSKADGHIVRVIENPSDSRFIASLIRFVNNNLDVDSKEMLSVDELQTHPYPKKHPFITEKGVRFIYQKYEIGAGALGEVDITIPFSDIADYMSEDALSLIGYE